MTAIQLDNNNLSFNGTGINMSHISLGSDIVIHLCKGTKVSINGKEYVLDTAVKIQADK